MGVAATGTVRANQMDNAPLQDMLKMYKDKRGFSDVVTDLSSSITTVSWKDKTKS